MFVFVDDSGDCGMKITSGSTQHVVLAACVFENAENVQSVWRSVNASRFIAAGATRSMVHKAEYKYAKTKMDRKDRLFEAVKQDRFAVRTILVDKAVIHSEYLRSNPNDMKAFLLGQLLTHTYGTVKNAKLIIDGNDTRAFGGSDKDYFMNTANATGGNVLSDVEFVDSKKNEIIQLADMIAGAIRKTACGDADAQRHFETFKERLWQPRGSYWRFK